MIKTKKIEITVIDCPRCGEYEIPLAGVCPNCKTDTTEIISDCVHCGALVDIEDDGEDGAFYPFGEKDEEGEYIDEERSDDIYCHKCAELPREELEKGYEV